MVPPYANSQAILADRKYLEREGPLNFYTLYRSHNYHFKLYAAMFLGQYRPALEAAYGRLAGGLCGDVGVSRRYHAIAWRLPSITSTTG